MLGLSEKIYDFAVIGAGVVGTAITRELSHYHKNVVLIEAENDIGTGTSKANTSIWHTGYDAKPGTLEAQLLTRSYELLKDYVELAGIPNERLGAVLVAWNEDQFNALPQIVEKAHRNGVTDVEQISVEKVYELEPGINKNALGGIIVPGESIICTYSLPLAMGYDAVLNDAEIIRGFRVDTIDKQEDFYSIKSNGNEIKSKYVINCAGLFSDKIDNMLGHQRFTVTPRRGELIVFDKLASSLVNHILLPIPTSITKGVLVSPTVFGNIMLGPTAEDLDDKTNKGTSEQGIESLWAKGEQIVSPLLKEQVTATYAGLRAATEHSDYQLFFHPEQNYICVGGIRSTGVSSCLGIAEYVRNHLNELNMLGPVKQDIKSCKVPKIGEHNIRPYQDAEMIKKDPDFGRIICHCERVTLGEIKETFNAPVPAVDFEGIKRRTRCSQGRCQGFHCQADIYSILENYNKN